MIKHSSLFTLFLLLWLAGYGQPATAIVPVDTTKSSIEYWEHWLAGLNEMGVDKKKDSFYVREEVVRMLKDSVYRKSVYPEAYTWPAAVDLMNRMELKKAFWHLINLYETDTAHRNIIVGTFLLYDSLVDMDKILLNTFYTYGLTDPRYCRIKNNKPDIFRPDIMEKKLRTTKEIVGYVWANRKRKSNNE